MTGMMTADDGRHLTSFCNNDITMSSAFAAAMSAPSTPCALQSIIMLAFMPAVCVQVAVDTCTCAGIAGGAGPNEDDASDGATVGEIYDPSKPVGQRWSQVADSMIWRLYHSEAFLTSNAEVFVSGSESTDEHRVQIYTPDYFYTSNPRPVITSVNASAQTAGVYDVDAQVGYLQNFTIGFSNVTTLDRVVFNRLVRSTHGVHADQRQIVLDCSVASGTAVCTSPPNNYIAAPGVYMLFVLNQGVPSQAKSSLQLDGKMTEAPAIAAAG